MDIELLRQISAEMKRITGEPPEADGGVAVLGMDATVLLATLREVPTGAGDEAIAAVVDRLLGSPPA